MTVIRNVISEVSSSPKCRHLQSQWKTLAHVMKNTLTLFLPERSLTRPVNKNEFVQLYVNKWEVKSVLRRDTMGGEVLVSGDAGDLSHVQGFLKSQHKNGKELSAQSPR